MGIKYYDRQLSENKGEYNMVPENKFWVLVYFICMKVDDFLSKLRRKRQYKKYLKYKKKHETD